MQVQVQSPGPTLLLFGAQQGPSGPPGPVNNAALVTAIDEDQEAALEALGIPKANYAAIVAPTVANDSSEGYSIGSKWYDSAAKEGYLCTDSSVGAAVWVEATFDGSEVAALIAAITPLSIGALPASSHVDVVRTTAQGTPEGDITGDYVGQIVRVGDEAPYAWYRWDSASWVDATEPLETPSYSPPSLEDLGGSPLVSPTILTPAAPLTLTPTAGTFVAGDRQLFHITPTGNQSLELSSIVVPSDSAITFPKTLTGGKLYVVQITYSGSFWMLTSLVGGYPTPS